MLCPEKNIYIDKERDMQHEQTKKNLFWYINQDQIIFKIRSSSFKFFE